ncbi:MAG: 60S ribosomal protein L24 [Marteilia pararefringens]
MTCKLSKDLQNKQGIKRLPVKRGDTVAIRAGSFAGSAGQVLSVDKKTFRLTVSKVEKSKASGNTFNVPIHYSNCELTRLKPKDLNREKVINKRQARMSAKQVNMEEQAQPAVAA